MRDVRDSIRDAIDRSLNELNSKPDLIKKEYAAKSVPHDAAAKALPMPKGVGAPAPPPPTGSDVGDLLQRAQSKLGTVKDEDVHADFIHTEDPDIALLLSALEQSSDAQPLAAEAKVIGVHKYDTTDPRWILSALNMIIHDKVPFLDPSGPNDQQVPIPDGDLTLGILGDWGTGLMSSSNIADCTATWKPDITIHLGDVYYSGTDQEEYTKFLKRFPRGKSGSFALNSNHEMYTGGHGYFDILLRDPDFAAKQKKSFFSLYNKTWQIIGLDSAYDTEKSQLYQNGNLRDSQIQWFVAQLAQAKTANRKVVILSHHNPFNVGDTGSDAHFLQQITAAAQSAGAGFDYWFWGHEHAVGVFKPQPMVDRNYNGRCIGHGGIPYSAGGNNPNLIWTETKSYDVGQGDPKCGLNGFGILRLPADGSAISEAYYDDSNNQRFVFTVPQFKIKAQQPVVAPGQQPQV